MNEIYDQAQKLLTEVIGEMQLELNILTEKTSEGLLFNLTGHDSNFLTNESGELLDAVETLMNQIYGRQIPRDERIIIDAEGFRQTRRAELQAMARFAANNVRKNDRPFTFGKLSGVERKIIHLTLVDEEDLKTESVGDGRERRLQVSLK